MPWIALLLLAAAPEAETPAWHPDYKVARPLAIEKKMPMLLVIDHPDAPHHQISHNDQHAEQESRLLMKYVRCRVDASTEYGAKVAAAFKVTKFPHTVVIDRSGRYQVFVHRGPMTDEEWMGALAGYQPPKPRPRKYCPP